MYLFMHPFTAQCAGEFRFYNNSAERCRLCQLSEFHLQLLSGVDTLPKILELCRLAGHVYCFISVLGLRLYLLVAPLDPASLTCCTIDKHKSFNAIRICQLNNTEHKQHPFHYTISQFTLSMKRCNTKLASHWLCVMDSVVYPPTSSTAIEREMSTLPTP